MYKSVDAGWKRSDTTRISSGFSACKERFGSCTSTALVISAIASRPQPAKSEPAAAAAPNGLHSPLTLLLQDIK